MDSLFDLSIFSTSNLNQVTAKYLIERVSHMIVGEVSHTPLKNSAEDIRETIHHSTIFRINTLYHKTGRVNEKHVSRRRGNLIRQTNYTVCLRKSIKNEGWNSVYSVEVNICMITTFYATLQRLGDICP